MRSQLCLTLRSASLAVLSLLGLPAALAQAPAVRLSGSLGASAATVPGSRTPLATLGTDAGVLPAGTALKGMTLVFSRSAAQEADFQALLAAQQDPGSPMYHQWLTPDSFAARFGVAASDLQTVESWLQNQGFSVDSVNRSHNAVNFSGTAGQVGTAFHTSLHQYKVGGETRFGPSTDLSLPAELAPMVAGVLHVSDIRPRPAVRLKHEAVAATPDFTSSQTQAHYLTPKDVATMYNVQSVYNAGYTGVGQSIAVAGQSYIATADITAFQTASGLPANAPTLVLVPNTGVAAVSSGDEGESDLDVEYASGMAPGAKVFLVYTGNTDGNGAFDALNYAVTENIAPVVSISYTACEPLISTATLNSYNTILAQAATQGQTILAAAGDEGSEACFGTNQPASVQEQLAVNFPASSQYVTAVGGTQMTTGASTAGSSSYWSSATGTDTISSLLSYVQETAWNEDNNANGEPSAGGGGVSIAFPRPSWQTGVPGIPTGTMRLLPDISLLSATGNPGYLYCSSDIDDLQDEDLTNSCVSGFRDSSGKYLLVAGGTSFATPVMAGLTAVLNQAKHATGQGVLNPELYLLAANSSTYSSAFHDITAGSIACPIADTSFCSTQASSGYSAGTGYDEATGLGSINFAGLVAAWPSTAATAKSSSVTTLAPASTTPAGGASDAITINVAPTTSGAALPTGSVAVSVDGGAAVTVALTAGTAAGTTTFPYTAATTGGSHVITALYSGDGTYAPSEGTTTVTITAGTLAAGSFTFTVGTVTVGAVNSSTGSTGSSNVSIVPGSNYNGSVVFTLSVPSTAPVVCYEMEYNSVPTYAVPVAGVTPATLVLGVGSAECGSATTDPSMRMAKRTAAPVTKAEGKPMPPKGHGRQEIVAFAGLVLLGFAGRRRGARRLPVLLTVAALAVLGLGLSGCGGNGTGESTATSTAVPATTSYTLTLVGMDSVTSSITSSTAFTLTVP